MLNKKDNKMRQQLFQGLGISLEEKVKYAIDLLKFHEQFALSFSSYGYHCCFSGGKDSIVIYKLLLMAGVKFKAFYNVTTIDPPELIYFIKKHYPDVKFLLPEKNFFTCLAENNGYPTRIRRWCCEKYKERNGSGEFKVIGVRAAESPKRAQNWKHITRWNPRKRVGKPSWCACPILSFSDQNVWDFIHKYQIPYCSLYDEGFKRLGCIGCPLGGCKNQKREFERWPRFKEMWLNAFRRLWERRKDDIITKGKNKGKKWPGLYGIDTPEKLFDWWLSGKNAPKEETEDCTMGLF